MAHTPSFSTATTPDCRSGGQPCPPAPAARSVLRRIGIAACGMVILLLVSRWWYDVHMLEKMLTRLAMPCGLIWCGLLLNLIVASAQSGRGKRLLAWLVFLGYWAGTNTFTGDRILGWLESRYTAVDPTTVEPFDTIIVLGGGTMSDPEQHVWLGMVGDRVMLAARLYQQGKAKHLVTTGVVQGWARGEAVDMSAATERIWRELGIPAAAITQIGGVNTSQELRNVKELLGPNPPTRVGLLTSAFHLPRAERLAKQTGVEVIPVPAGFLSPADEPLPLALIPHYYGVTMIDLAAKEFLAAVVSR